jgi:dephospho-CoA kinase
MKVIGVTGGMASGKTTVARLIAREQYPHLDADHLVHVLMRDDKEMIAAIAAAFPSSLVDGVIDRRVLSQFVAQDAAAIGALEAIIHPRVRMAEERAINEARTAGKEAVILDIPLLFETDAEKLCDMVVAASAPKSVRRQRAFARANMTEAKWQRLVDRQLHEQERNMRADHVVMTDGTLEETEAQVAVLLDLWGLK